MKFSSSKLIAAIVSLSILSCTDRDIFSVLEESPNDLHFKNLATVWDEGIPLGNGMLGVLVWKNESKLRLSLDRADLWDLRPTANLDKPEWKYSWVHKQWEVDDYKPVQELFDVPYNRDPAPSKIPGAALEFDISSLGEIEYVHLYINSAICEVKWKNGARFLTFVHATEPVGCYLFDGLANPLDYELIPPAYARDGNDGTRVVYEGQDLRRLGYSAGKMSSTKNSINYKQEGWGGFEYEVNVQSENKRGNLGGWWSISAKYPDWPEKPIAAEITQKGQREGIVNVYKSHLSWWKNYWAKSSIHIPHPIIQKQWYLEQYKFGSVARAGCPPISLQAVWTADNGKLPPWKGDFHNDLNTQLSYWASYSGNHLDEESGYIEWLWKNRETFKKYTKNYFDADGINTPGVATLTGEPMGGWIQYAFGPTVSAWQAQHFYLHWRFSMDRQFLEQKAYPWIRDVALFLENISALGKDGTRKLPLSSSPELFNNSRQAWFDHPTNFDLALIKWTYEKAMELALELKLPQEAEKWATLYAQWPDLQVDQSGLMFARDLAYTHSHRHFSHLLAFHPLGIIDYSGGSAQRQIIDNSISTLDEKGASGWCGYSYSWLANMKARAFDGLGAATALEIFATSFCLPNSFHANGDQSGKGYSNFTYRPFTLEGNFAFAAGLQEMLIQSHTGVVNLFPAVPDDWKDIQFNQLRTEGAFLVSAKKQNGLVNWVKIRSEKGGSITLKNPFDQTKFESSARYDLNTDQDIVFETQTGDAILLTRTK